MPSSKNTQPHSLESETVVLASCLLSEDGSVYDEVSQVIQPSDFYVTRNSIIFSTIGEIVGKGLELSDITLLEQLRSNGNEDEVGGISTIYTIQEACETSTHATYAANIVKEKSKLRQTIRHCRLAIEEAEEGEEEADSVTSKLEASLQSLQDVDDGKGDGSIRSAAEALREDYKAMVSGTYEVSAMPTRIAQVDEKLSCGGVANGEVMVIAAPTSCGKTALALNIVLQNAVTHDTPGLYF